MRLNVWNVQRRCSAAAAALVVMSLLLGSVGAMSVVAIDGYGSIAQGRVVPADAIPAFARQ